MSRDGKTLYVANGANNAVAVLDSNDNPAPPCAASFRRAGTHGGGAGRGRAAALHRQRLRVRLDRARVQRGARAASYRDRMGVVSVVDVPGAQAAGRLTRPGHEQQQRAWPPTAPARRCAPPRSDESRAAIAHPARFLRHQGESNLRPGVRRPSAGQRRPVARAVRPRGDAEPSRAGREVCSARQLSTRPAISPRWATAGARRATPATGCTSTATAATTRTPCCSRPPIFSGTMRRGARRDACAAYGERGQYTITPPPGHLDGHLHRLEDGAGTGPDRREARRFSGCRDIYRAALPGLQEEDHGPGARWTISSRISANTKRTANCRG